MNPALLPVVVAQGLWVRRTVEVLPEAAGPKRGTVGGRTDAGEHVVVVGESTAAGCGASTHDAAFAGAFARARRRRYGHPVTWTVHARNGATVRAVRHSLLPGVDGAFDIAVLLIGVNDVLTRTPLAQWRAGLSAVLDELASRGRAVVMAGVPPFATFPALPNPLRRYLAERGHALDAVANDVCATRERVQWVASSDLIPSDPAFFARDGFHPSSEGYAQWADAMTARMVV